MFGLDDFPWLTAMIAVPALAGALVWLLKPLRRFARPIGLVVSLLVLAAGALLAAGFDMGASDQVQYAYSASWIPARASAKNHRFSEGMITATVPVLPVARLVAVGWAT